MSAHIVSILSGGVPLAAVLTASLLGSAHCAGMCGGLVTSLCPTRGHQIRYHAGRLAAYAALGAGAGALGRSVFSVSAQNGLGWVAAALMAATFAFMGWQVWRGRAPHLSFVPQRVVSTLYRRAGQVPAALGALSAFLPCGWLQSFVLAAAATRGAASGAALLAVFWAGTLPALAATPWLARSVLRPAAARAPRLTAILLLVAGLSGVGLKMSTLFAADGHPHCHCEHAAAGAEEP